MPSYCKYIHEDGKQCESQSVYNFPNQKPPIYCPRHKLDGMIRVYKQMCKHVSEDGSKCETGARFNMEGERKPLYCDTHKLEGMINIIDPRCIHSECKTIAGFNYPNENKRLYCNKHKLPDMVNIRSVKCKAHGCSHQPSYNYPNIKSAKYCGSHKLPDMINVIEKRYCVVKECKTRAHYNMKGEKPIYCGIHKKNGMINVAGQLCEMCDTRAGYNFPNLTSPIRCVEHIEDGMIDVKNRRCKSEFCDTFATSNKYDGYCSGCFFDLFPDSPIVLRIKRKENEVSSFIKSNFPDHNWICDKRIKGGSSKRRPDMLCDFEEYVLIIEVDEKQHSTYGYSNESDRLEELINDVDNRPIIFIRFNPDSYVKIDGKKEPSPWSENVLKNEKKWNERLECLNKTVDYWIDNGCKTTIEIKLFYDECDTY